MTREEALQAIKEKMDYYESDKRLRGAIETLIPELSESVEDERIRKEIDTLYSEIDTCISELLKARTDKDSEAEGKALFKMEGLMVATLQDLSCIEDYLEKQKETSINWMKSDNVKNPDKPYIDKAGRFYTTDGRMCYASEIEKQRDENAKDSFERGIRVGMIRQQKEQKPIKWTDLTWKDIVELEGIINNVHYDFSAGIGQESFGKEVLERFRSTKGIEYLDEAEQKCWQEEEQKEQKSAECEDCAMYLSGNCIHPNGKCENAKSKPEWNEEDEMMRENIISDLRYFRDCATDEEAVSGYNDEIAWLKDISLNHKKFTEAVYKLWSNDWSEEDKVMLDNIIWGVHMKSIKPLDEMDDRSGYKKYEDFLKALPERFNPQPKQEWSEEDKEMLECVIMDVESAKKNYLKSTTEVVRQGAIIADKELAWLKALRPQWKPSKEQMDRLFSIVAALRKDYCDDMADFLANLHADLKKLGVKEEPEYYQHFEPDC